MTARNYSSVTKVRVGHAGIRNSAPAAVRATPLRAPIVYLINQYPAVTHTFIKREVLALERQGIEVIRVAARAGSNLVDPGDKDEERRTTYLLRRPLGLLKALIWFLILRPHRFAAALATTCRMMRKSDRGPVLHVFYLVEACGVAAIVRDTGATHIHAHFGTNPAEVALLASKLCSVTYSFTVHGYDEYDKPQFIALSEKIRGSAFVAAVSYYGRSQLFRWSEDVDRAKIKVVRCGLEERFHHGADEALSEAPRFLCVGRLCREKGQDVLVKAAALMVAAGHTIEVAIVGDGEGRAELEGLIKDLGLSGTVRILGWRSSAEVRCEMMEARALVVPSLAENLPVVIMEAMALRRPVIASQLAGIPELVIPGENGWLTPASSVEALAAAMTACLTACPDELRVMGQRGRERVLTNHHVDHEAAVLADLFAGCVSSHSDGVGVARQVSTASE
jgi:colanic acid/amylovoran biosynthesis glycosyltransferase